MGVDPKSLLSDLILMVMVDGKVKPSEIQLIQKLAERMKISKTDVKKLLKDPKSGKPPFSEADRITQFYKLMLVMQVDGETHASELDAIVHFGLKMGIRPVVAQQILKKMNQYENGIVPADELLKIFKIYYN